MKKLKEKLKYGKKGITLIALVITIIVLLILAGVSISILTGDNGILTKANEAKENTNETSIEESIKIEISGSFNEMGKYNSNLAKNNLEKNLGATVEENSQNNTLKVTYKAKNFLVDKNGNVFKIEIPEDLEIGDIVFYTPESQEYLWESQYSGNSSNITLNNTTNDYSINKWKVLNINDNGTIDLIAEKPTDGTVPLGYAQGYNNGVKLLNDACNQLYGNTNLGIVSRNINEEDIKSKMTTEALNSIKNSGTDSPILCGEQIKNAYISENSKYPCMYANEKLSTINSKKNENGLDTNEQHNFIEKDYNGSVDGAITNAESIQPYQTYWYRNSTDTQNIFQNIGTESSTQFYDLLMPNGRETMYWLASRSIHTSQISCDFGIRIVFWRNE